MTSPIPSVRAAIYTLLRNSLALIALSRDSHLLALVYDVNSLPDNLAPPYTVLRSIESVGNPLRTSSFTNRAMELLLTIDTWAFYEGSQQVDVMHEAVYATLNEQEDAINALITGFKCTNCLFDTNNQLVDDSTSVQLLHGVERYQLRMEAL